MSTDAWTGDAIALNDIAEFLDRFFAVHRFGDDQGGIYHPSTRPIRRIGLALEPWTGLEKWAKSKHLDALFFHRPWKLKAGQLAPDVGIVAYHLAFDERMTLGFNPRLADVLGMSALEVLGEKERRPIGTIGEIATQTFVSYCDRVREIFGGYDETLAGSGDIQRVAVVGAMTDALIREAAMRSAGVYITGQLRQPAAAAVEETGIRVIAVGHRRSEEWGLRSLAGVLRDRYFDLEVVLPPLGTITVARSDA
ncbi:Nif3-like dinuclear metal center hexameric protein [Coleofasciculus sp. FACHB-1120]|uniref:Nif3-like dinuclear metal center hexameric protein n=1 Tax=Coleofasciculus sp. FACHB-1120 TaxID=2692783 RepID=UPI00168580DD|nr:Nif3-like dinuclear metal center hexameric protein [Coleofasciculus sp. FACHB-1120]MBD2740738.1 Nif3-like dinuclear metal center hexameric protein [Coleofasciculus sp. FACHB-1120]